MSRDSRATTYSKCVSVENTTSESTPKLPLNMAIMPINAGVDVASRRCYVVWAVDGLPPLAQGLGTLRGGGLVVLFRNSLARIRDGGAPAARFNFPST